MRTRNEFNSGIPKPIMGMFQGSSEKPKPNQKSKPNPKSKSNPKPKQHRGPKPKLVRILSKSWASPLEIEDAETCGDLIALVCDIEPTGVCRPTNARMGRG
jgi:hypothetical protein